MSDSDSDRTRREDVRDLTKATILFGLAVVITYYAIAL